MRISSITTWVILMARKALLVLLVLQLLQFISSTNLIAGADLQRDFQTLAQSYAVAVRNGIIRFDFDYFTVNDLSGSSDTIPGVIWLQGELFRLEAAGNLFLQDNHAFYQIYRTERQLLIDQLPTTDDGLQPVRLLSRLEEHFQPIAFTQLPAGGRSFQLMPLQSDWLLEAWLQADGTQILALELQDINGTRTVIHLTAEQQVVDTADTLFQLPGWTGTFDIFDLRGADR